MGIAVGDIHFDDKIIETGKAVTADKVGGKENYARLVEIGSVVESEEDTLAAHSPPATAGRPDAAPTDPTTPDVAGVNNATVEEKGK